MGPLIIPQEEDAIGTSPRLCGAGAAEGPGMALSQPASSTCSQSLQILFDVGPVQPLPLQLFSFSPFIHPLICTIHLQPRLLLSLLWCCPSGPPRKSHTVLRGLGPGGLFWI